MAYPSSSESLASPTRLKKRLCVLDLNESPPPISYENENRVHGNTIPIISTFCSQGQANVNMLEEALASIPLSFKRQETSKSILVLERGMLTLIQHPTQEPQGKQKRGLRTSWTVHYVDGHFELPSDCANYILIRDKYRQEWSRLMGERPPNAGARSCHLSVHDRLDGWRVETRKRPDDKTHDKFYHHKSSKRMFRSLVEVERFIKYEIYPPKPRRLNKKAPKPKPQ